MSTIHDNLDAVLPTRNQIQSTLEDIQAQLEQGSVAARIDHLGDNNQGSKIVDIVEIISSKVNGLILAGYNREDGVAFTLPLRYIVTVETVDL